MMLHQIKNENSRFSDPRNPQATSKEFTSPIFYKNFFKTPLTVNNCVESFLGPSISNYSDYASAMVLSEVLTFNHFLPMIREKGGAYGAGCSVNESGLMNFYSYRDPKIESTYENFEKGVDAVLDSKDLDPTKL